MRSTYPAHTSCLSDLPKSCEASQYLISLFCFYYADVKLFLSALFSDTFIPWFPYNDSQCLYKCKPIPVKLIENYTE